jgi:electron transfer flavoprotein beta subunit
MNIVVCIKQVPDSESTLKLASKDQLDFSQLKRVMNPYDEFAVEEALVAKQKHFPSAKVVAVTVGPESAQEVLRTALAMGCDEAKWVAHEVRQGWLSPLTIGKALVSQIKEFHPVIVFCGRQAIDYDQMQVPYVLAHELRMSCVNNVRSLDYQAASNQVTVMREADGSQRETYVCPLPAVIGLTSGVNKPRYPSLPGIMKAKKYPLVPVNLSGILSQNELEWVTPLYYELPPERGTCKMISGDTQAQVNELVRVFREDLKLV